VAGEMGVQCSIYAAKILNGFAAVNFGAVLRDELQNHGSAQRFDEAAKFDSRLGSGTVAVIAIMLAVRGLGSKLILHLRAGGAKTK
jgi:hypothetical protein